jgi:hypothetical protein
MFFDAGPMGPRIVAGAGPGGGPRTKIRDVVDGRNFPWWYDVED